LSAALIFVLQVGSVSAQSDSSQDNSQKSYRVVSEATYNRVLDIVFPRDDPDPSETIFSFVLRFEPNSKPESQIVIRRRADKVEVFEYTLSNDDVYTHLNEILTRTGKEDVVEMAKSIRVNRRVTSISLDQAKQWYTAFFDSLTSTTKKLRERGEEFDKTGSESFILHGATYNLWYKQSLNKMSFSLYDVEVDTPGFDGEFKLVQWMNAVRLEVGKLK
jgi:hypothetical protein